MSDDVKNPILAALDEAEEFTLDDTTFDPAPLEFDDLGGTRLHGSDAEVGSGETQEERAARRKADWRRVNKANWLLNLNLACADHTMTDLGNANRFVSRFGKNFLFVEQWGWLAWDGRRWNTKDAEAILNRAVHATIRAIAGEAKTVAVMGAMFASYPETVVGEYDGEEPLLPSFDPIIEIHRTKGVIRKSDKLAGWCIASQSNAHVSCVAKLAQAYLTATPDQFNADLMAFNVANGTLRFAKSDDGSDYVQFGRHRREDMMTRLADVTYDPAALCPVYDAFLEKVQPDSGMREHLHVWGGVSLTALAVAKLAFWYGKGRNGKSTCIDAWGHVMGEYSQTIPIESFLDQGRAKQGGQATPDIASLPDVRCLRTSEPGRGSQLDEGLIKLVTGGEPLRARHLNKDFFEFRPAFKLTMQGNYRPTVGGTDEGFWRRMILVPWDVTIAEAEVDPLLPEKLRAEASGILNRLLDGLRVYLDRGLVLPDQIVIATADYRDDSDPIGRFLKECTIDVPPTIDDKGHRHDARVAGKEIFETYVAWARAMGEKPWSPKGFSRGLQDHGVKRLKSSGMFYLGLTMTKFAANFEGAEIEALAPEKWKKRD